MLRETRYERLASYPGPLDQCLSFTGAVKLTRASFPVLVLQATNAGVRTASVLKSLGDPLYKEHNTLHSLAGVSGL